jgi:hypothetical protein
VPVPRPRHPDQFLSGHFLATKKRLEELIYKSEEKGGNSGPPRADGDANRAA